MKTKNWEIIRADSFERASSWYQKKRKREFEAVLRNLGRYLEILNLGTRPLQMTSLGFVHDERKGVHALSESGGGKGLQATRLYVFPEGESRTAHLITIGDKKSRADDVLTSQAYAARRRAEVQREHEKTEDKAGDEDVQERGGNDPPGSQE